MSRQKGFTLVEIIIALLLFSLLLLVLYQSLDVVVNSWTAQGKGSYHAQARRIIQLRIGKELNNVFFNGSKRYHQFVGKNDRLVFLQEKEEMIQEFALVFSKEERQLCWSHSPWEGEFDGGGKNIPIITNIQDLTFRYYNAQKHLWQIEWQDTTENILPALVEIKITWANDNMPGTTMEPIVLPIFLGSYTRNEE